MESDHIKSSRILHNCRNAVYTAADGIGVCVGFVRFQAMPCIRRNVTALGLKLASSRSDTNRNPSAVKADPCFKRSERAQAVKADKKAAKPCHASTPVEESGTVFHPKSTTPPRQLKKYNYWWALARIEQLKKSGMTDPVGYFNNEMSDWWLAPDGMMENEADFEGIARAIEEHWDQ